MSWLIKQSSLLPLLLVVVAVSLHSAAGMSEAMMREAREKTDFWQHLDYSAIRAQRGGATAAAGDGDGDDDDDDDAGRARARVSTACSSGSAGGFACSNVDLQSFLTLEDIGCGTYNNDIESAGYGNDIWGWTSPSGQEIAIVGCSTGTSFVDITNAESPSFVGFLARTTAATYWSDIKVYGDYAYIASESSGSGLQIFNLATVATDATNGLTAQVYTPTSTYTGVSTTHNLEVNEQSGYMYVLGAYGGSDSCSGGLHVLDVQDPANPVFVTCYTGADYVHDAHCVMYHGPDTAYQGREVCMTFSEDKIVMLDVTLKCDIQVISSSTYTQRSYTHQGWFSEDHKYFTMGDEMDENDFGVNTRTLFWDATSLSSPSLMKDYRALTTSVDHNQYNVNKYIFQSNYCGGLRILNGSIPVPMTSTDNVQEVGYFEVSTSCSGVGAPWLGSWSNYPFFHSGNVAVSSIEMGLFVLRPQFYGSGAVSVAGPASTITRSECVPTQAPTVFPTVATTLLPTDSPTVATTLLPTISPTVATTLLPTDSPTVVTTLLPTISPTVATTLLPTISPTVATTLLPTDNPTVTPDGEDCVNFVVSMSDTYGDGWNGNYLYFDAPEQMQTTLRKVTLISGHSGSATLCYPPGIYSPFACGGTWKQEVGWSIVGYGVSGGASNCQPTAGASFQLLAEGQTLSPTGFPTLSPTQFPTTSPTQCPTERTITVQMSDSYGDGWNGNYLYFDDAASMTTTELKMTFSSGYSATKSICLPIGTYTPFACGGGWPYECSWVIEGRGISGGASTSCTPSGGSFIVSDGEEGCCCDDKLNQVLANQATMIDPSIASDGIDSVESPGDSSSNHVEVDVITLVVGTIVFAGVLAGTVAVAVFNRERYLALDEAYSGGQTFTRSFA